MSGSGHYHCRGCGHDFEEPRLHREVELHEFWGEPVRRAVVTEQCPYCESEDFDAIGPEDRDVCDDDLEDCT
jgi:hypothetical protein